MSREIEIDAGVSYPQHLDMRLLVHMQISRCLQAAGTPVFPDGVRALKSLLPTSSRQKLDKMSDVWILTEPTLMYRRFSGRRVGSPQAPRMREERPGTPYTVRRHEDGRVDWSDPNIISPVLREHTTVDYDRFFECILEEFEAIGVYFPRLTKRKHP